MTMVLKEHFRAFLESIRPTLRQRTDAREAHIRLRAKLAADVPLDEHVITTFLQGSYRRSTDVRPVGDKKSDVDIVVVTNMSEGEFTAEAALEEFRPFLEKNYAGCFEMQDRSWGIVDGEVELDLVPTSAPSEADTTVLRSLRESEAAVELGLEQESIVRGVLREAAVKGKIVTAALAKSDDWREEPLRIPDRTRREWKPTHPLMQIQRTAEKNASCNTHFVDVVRCVKWWHLEHAGDVHPRGYPLEALVFKNCPDGLASIAEGFTETLRSMRDSYRAIRQENRKPEILDHGVPTHDVLQRLSQDEFNSFYDLVALWAPFAERALAESDTDVCKARWAQIFGRHFPGWTDGGGDGGSPREFPEPPPKPPAVVPTRRYA